MKQHIQTGTLIALVVAGLALIGIALYKLAALAILVLIAVVFTTGIDPMVQWLQRATGRWFRLPRAVAILTILCMGLLVLAGITALLVFTGVKEALLFARETWPGMRGNLLHWLQDLSARYSFIPDPATLYGQLSQQSGRMAGYLLGTTRAVFGLIGGVFSAVSVFILTFFFSYYKDGITYTLAQFIPPAYQRRTLEISHLAARKMGGWLRGQLVLALIITVTIWVAMLVLQVRYATLLGIIGGLGELVPMLGPYVAFFPALAIALATGKPLWVLITLLIFFVALSQTENYLLSPKIMERQVEISPVTTILALLVGGSLLGLVGALLAIPVAAAGRVVLLEAVFPAIQRKSRREIEAGMPVATPAPAPKAKRAPAAPAPSRPKQQKRQGKQGGKAKRPAAPSR